MAVWLDQLFAGNKGVNAYTTLTASFVQPAANSNVTAQVRDNSWIAAGQYLYLPLGGWYVVSSTSGPTTVVLTNTGQAAVGSAPANASPGTTIPLGTVVTPAGPAGSSGASLPTCTEQQSLFFHGSGFTGQGARQYLNIMAYGAKVDDVTDDTPAWKEAIADVGSRASSCVIFVPNTGKRSQISDSLRIYQSSTTPFTGLVIEGEGGWSDGTVGATSGIRWAGQQIRGTGGVTSTKHTNVILVTGLSGLLTAQAGGGTAAQVGDILESWGCVHFGNNGRFPIVQIINDTSCYVWNPNGVSGETGMSWLLERNLLDMRFTGMWLKNLHFTCMGNTYLTSYLTFSQSPLPGGNPVTAPRMDHVTFANDNIIIAGKYPIVRWSYKIGSQFVPQVGNPNYAVDGDGFVIAQSPANCDLGEYSRCFFGYMEQGGVVWDNTNGNDYGHAFYACDFVQMPMGAYCVAPQSGQGNFYECGGGNIWDTVFQIGASTLRTCVVGGHTEQVGCLASAANSIDITNHTAFMANTASQGWSSQHGVGAPLGTNPFGDVVSVSGDFSIQNCSFNPGPIVAPMHFLAVSPDPNTEIKVHMLGNQMLGNDFQHGGGNGCRPFYLTTTKMGPYKLVDGQTITFTITDGATGITSSTKTVTFHSANFRDIGRCWPWEIAYAWQLDSNSAGTIPWFRGDGTGIVIIKAGSSPQAGDAITFTGGTAATELGTGAADAHSVPDFVPTIVRDTAGTVYAIGPVHLIASANAGSDIYSLTLKSFPLPEIDKHYFNAATVPDNIGPSLRNQSPGLSMGAESCRNLGGDFVFPGSGATSANVLFTQAEINPDYDVLVVGVTGFTIVGKSCKGFTITCGSAPGAVPVTWQIFRPQPAGADPVVFPPTGGLASPVLWIDPQYSAGLSSVSSVAASNSPDDLRPTIHTITDLAHGVVFTTTGGKNDIFRIDRDDQRATTNRQPNGWPFLYSCFQTEPGALDASAGTIFTTDEFTVVFVCGIPVVDDPSRGQPAYTVGFNGLGLVYNWAGTGSRSLDYFGVASYPDTILDAEAGVFELIEISKTTGAAPVLKVNGVTRTLTGAPTTFTPNTVRQIGVDDQPVCLAFAAAWATDVSASMSTLRTQLNTKYKLF